MIVFVVTLVVCFSASTEEQKPSERLLHIVGVHRYPDITAALPIPLIGRRNESVINFPETAVQNTTNNSNIKLEEINNKPIRQAGKVAILNQRGIPVMNLEDERLANGESEIVSSEPEGKMITMNEQLILKLDREYTPYEMADYIFSTRDERGIVQLISDMVLDEQVTPDDAVQYLEDVQLNLQKMRSEFKKHD